MKAYCEILRAETTGGLLRLRLQGKFLPAAEWAPTSTFELEVPLTKASQHVYHVGREVILTLEPKP